MDKKEFGLDLKAMADTGEFEGYASTFGGAPDSYGDVITPGAFIDSLTEHRRKGTMPMMFFGHNASELPVGDWLDFAEDGKGLWAKGQIAMDDPVGSRIYAAMKAKRIRGLSIGYRVKSSHPDEKMPGVTHLDKIDLREVSIVNLGANERALVTDVKSILRRGQLPTVREFEKHLRDEGFSRSLAAAIAGKAAPHLRGEPDSGPEQLRSFLDALKMH